MSNSSLVSYTNISPNKTSPRTHKIDRITIHCFVGQVDVQAGVNAFKSALKMASCNYVVAKDGKIGLVVEEKDRSWCSSNKDNDHRAITIECASDTKAPYMVTDACLNSLIKLIADVCKRNGIKKMVYISDKKVALSYQPKSDEAIFTMHCWFKNKACPGEYLISMHPYICNSVNALLSAQEPQKQPSNTFKVKITVDSLNVRNKPSVNGMIVAVAKKGVYTIVATEGNWGLLSSYKEGKNGWINISQKYCQRV